MSAAACRTQRTHVACRHRLAAHGHRRQPDDDRRRVAAHAAAYRWPTLQRTRRSSGCWPTRAFGRRWSKTRSAPTGSTTTAFDIGRHVQREALRRRKRGEKPARRAASAASPSWRRTPLDPSRPLWQFQLIEDLRRRAQRDGRAHPPLHRRRHRADLGDAVDRRRRQGATAAQAPRGQHARRRQRLADRRGDQALRPTWPSKAIGMSGNGVGKSMEMLPQPRPAADRLARGGAHGRPDRAATSPRSR